MKELQLVAEEALCLLRAEFQILCFFYVHQLVRACRGVSASSKVSSKGGQHNYDASTARDGGRPGDQSVPSHAKV